MDQAEEDQEEDFTEQFIFKYLLSNKYCFFRKGHFFVLRFFFKVKIFYLNIDEIETNYLLWGFTA